MKIINHHKNLILMNLHLKSILIVGLCSIPLYPASSFAGGPESEQEALQIPEDSESATETDSLLKTDKDQTSPPPYTSIADLPPMASSVSSSTVYSPLTDSAEQTQTAYTTQQLSLAVAEKIRLLEIAEATHNSNPTRTVIPYGDSEKNSLQELLDKLHVDIIQSITRQKCSARSLSEQYLKNLVATSPAVTREKDLATPIQLYDDTSSSWFSCFSRKVIRVPQFYSVDQFHQIGMQAAKQDPQQYLAWIDRYAAQIPLMGPLEYVHWLTIVPQSIQRDFDTLLSDKFVGSFSFYPHPQVLDFLNRLPLSLTRKYWKSSQKLLTASEWIQWVQARTVSDEQGVHLFQTVDRLFHLGIDQRIDAEWMVTSMQRQPLQLIVGELETLINRMASVLTSQALDEMISILYDQYSHDPLIQKKIRALQQQFTQQQQSPSVVIRNAFQEEIAAIDALPSAVEKINRIKAMFTKGETLKHLGNAFTMQHLLQILYTIPTETVYADNADTLVSLRNKLRDYTGNPQWTAWDLHHMHVSRNLALVGSIMTRIPADASPIERQQVLSVVRTFFAQSEVRNIQSNPDKIKMKPPTDRQVFKNIVEKFFQLHTQ